MTPTTVSVRDGGGASGDSDGGASRRTTCPTPLPFGQSWRAMVSDTTATPASAVRSASVKARPLTRSKPSTLKYSDDTAISSTGSLLGLLGDTGVTITPRGASDDAATSATDGSALRAWSTAARRDSDVEVDRQRVDRPYAWIFRRGGEGASQKNGGTDQEESRDADLDRDQGMPCAARTRIPDHFTPHGRHQVEASGLQRRREPEERRGHDGASHQEHEHSPVGAPERQGSTDSPTGRTPAVSTTSPHRAPPPETAARPRDRTPPPRAQAGGSP